MDKTVAGLLGAMGALVVAGPSQAAPAPASTDSVLQARSYAELLRPVANPVETLRALDEAAAPVQAEPVQYYYRNDHHHHHHQRYVRRYYHHHHHHHHHHQRPALGIVIR